MQLMRPYSTDVGAGTIMAYQAEKLSQAKESESQEGLLIAGPIKTRVGCKIPLTLGGGGLGQYADITQVTNDSYTTPPGVPQYGY